MTQFNMTQLLYNIFYPFAFFTYLLVVLAVVVWIVVGVNCDECLRR